MHTFRQFDSAQCSGTIVRLILPLKAHLLLIEVYNGTCFRPARRSSGLTVQLINSFIYSCCGPNICIYQSKVPILRLWIKGQNETPRLLGKSKVSIGFDAVLLLSVTLLTHHPNTSWIHEIHELKRVPEHLNFVPVPGLPLLWGHSASRHFVYGIFGWFCDIMCFCWLVHSPWRNLFKRYRFWRRCSWWPLLFHFGVREWRFPSSSHWLSSLELMRSSPQGPYRFDTLSQPTKGRIVIQLVPL